MRMTDSFSRIFLMIRAHVLTHFRTYMLCGLFAFLLQLLLILLVKLLLKEKPISDYMQYTLFYSVAYFSVSIMASWFARPLRATPDNLLSLTCPCKKGERIASVILWVGVVQVLILAALYYVAFWVSGFVPTSNFSEVIGFQKLLSNEVLWQTNLLVVTSLNAIVFVAGGVFFKRLALIKTWLTLFALSYGTLMLAVGLLLLFDGNFAVKPLWRWLFSGQVSPDLLLMQMPGMVWIQLLTSICYGAVLYVLLREKQV